MKRFSVLFAAIRAVVFCSVIFIANISGHGFATRTLIKTAEGGWRHIDSIYGHSSSYEQYISSYDFKTKRCLRVKVKSAGESVSNCYVSMWFDSSPEGGIKCTPVQEFYLPEKKKWASAYKLKVGDKVLSFGKELKAITRIQFVKQPLTVYALHMKGIHNYMVGKYAVLTHNIALTIPYVAWASIGVAFGEGAVTGGTAGAYFGPVTCVVGAAALGVMFAGSVLFFGDNKRTRYQSHFHAGYFESKFGQDESQEESHEEKQSSDEAAGGGGPPPPEDEDPRRPGSGNSGYQQKSGEQKSGDKRGDQELVREIRSLTKRMMEHKAKLDEYIKNPEKHDNKNFLKNARSAGERTNIINSRTRLLNGEIKQFQQKIANAAQELGRRGVKWN